MLPLLLAALFAPVPGPVTREFHVGPDPFARGAHRGVDLAAPAGATVRAACSGRVLVARGVPRQGRVVTVRCGGRRVTHLPLRTVTVRAGARVRRGARIGTAGRSTGHAGLHVGVRREGDRFGYVRPRFTSTPPSAAPPPRRPPPAAPTRPQRWPARERPPAADRPPLAEPPPLRAPERVPLAERAPLAPPLAWAGLALALCGALGTVRWRFARHVEPGLKVPARAADTES